VFPAGVGCTLAARRGIGAAGRWHVACLPQLAECEGTRGTLEEEGARPCGKNNESASLARHSSEKTGLCKSLDTVVLLISCAAGLARVQGLLQLSPFWLERSGR